MTNKAFKIQGTFRMGRLKQQPFTFEVVSPDEASAREHAYTELGSRHGTKRRDIRLQTVEAVPDDEASPVSRHRMNKE